MSAPLEADEILRIRMRALGLDGSAGAASVTDVVERLFALQAQDWRSARQAVGVRAPGLTSSDVVAAMNAGQIVRSWPMRGTIHLVAARDIGWMQRLTNAKVLAGAPARRALLGITDAVLERATAATAAALTGGHSLSRSEIDEVWTAAGIDWQPNWRYHLIWWLCQTGVTTFGPVAEASTSTSTSTSTAVAEPRLVLAREWITEPRELSGDAALTEFAWRYVRGRGAVSRKDLASWALLPAASAARGLALAAESGIIVPAARAGYTGVAAGLWLDPEARAASATPAPAEPAEPASTRSASAGSASARPATAPVSTGSWQLLPAFDEHLLGFSDRSPQFDARHLAELVPGRNGMFLATVVHDGRAVGTWKRDDRRGTLTVTPFTGETINLAALARPAERLAEFSGEPAPTLVAA